MPSMPSAVATRARTTCTSSSGSWRPVVTFASLTGCASVTRWSASRTRSIVDALTAGARRLGTGGLRLLRRCKGRRAKLRREAPVDIKDLTGDEAGFFGDEIQDRVGYIFVRTAAPQRQVLAAALGRQLVRRGRPDRVHADAERTQVDRERAREAVKAALRRVVDGVVEVRALRSADGGHVHDRAA